MNKRLVTIRQFVKWSILVLIAFLSLIHIYGNKAIWAPLDAYCPFGALETGWKFITQGGFLEKIQPSNLALWVALVITTLTFGGVFCGWICPLGTLQDGLNQVARWLRIPQFCVSQKFDKLLRWLRLPVLILVLIQSITLASLWFADYDPFRLVLGFHWLSEPDKILVGGWIAMGLFLILSLLIRRFWCRYLCPLGLIVQWLSKLSWLKIRWRKPECLACDACSKSCPLGLNVQNEKLCGTACNNCLQCVAVCPRPQALNYKAKLAQGPNLALLGVVAFGVLLAAAQLAGWWNPKIGSDPAGIKGWMTLGYISETYRIPIDELKKEFKLPENANRETELRSFEDKIPNYSIEIFREFVAKRVGSKYTASNEKAKEADSTETQPKSAPVLKTNKEDSKENPERETNNQSVISIKDPEEIKGTMTLKEVSEGWLIPLSTLIEKLGLPKDVNPNVPIKEYDTPYGVGGARVREVVKELLKN